MFTDPVAPVIPGRSVPCPVLLGGRPAEAETTTVSVDDSVSLIEVGLNVIEPKVMNGCTLTGESSHVLSF